MTFKIKRRKITPVFLVATVLFSSVIPQTWASSDVPDAYAPPIQESVNDFSWPKGEVSLKKKIDGYVSVSRPAIAGQIANPKPISRKFSSKDVWSYAGDEVIVRFRKSKIDLRNSVWVAKSTKFSSDRKLKAVDIYAKGNFSVLKSSSWESSDTLVARLKKDPEVEFVQPNYRYQSLGSDLSSDTYGASLWGLHNVWQTVNGTFWTNDKDIDAPEAWSLNEGTNSVVIVAVIDSGVAYNHPDLLANMWDGSGCKSENGSYLGWCAHGYDFQDNDKNPLPTISDHWTHVAWTIAAVKGNSVGIAWVAPHAKIMAIKHDWTTSSIVKSINFAKQNGAKVINASFWGYMQTPDVAMYEAIRDFPWIFVAAAGNESKNHDSAAALSVSYPAGYRVSSSAGPWLANVIAVAATTQTDSIAYFSNYGPKSVDMGAPGTNVYSTVPSTETVTTSYQNFLSVQPPALPSGFEKTGNWGTYDIQDGSFNKVLFTDLGTPYADNSNYAATAPTLSLAWADSASIDFWTACDTQYDTQYYRDYVTLEYSSDGKNFAEALRWNEVTIDSNTSPSGAAFYHFKAVPIPTSYLTSNFRYRFRWVTDSSDGNYDGCFVDEIKVFRSDLSDGSDNRYAYMQGTSMAAPHVAWAAAVAWAYSPGSSISDIVKSVVDSWDPASSLSSYTISGKRLNLHRTLASLTLPSVESISAYSEWQAGSAVGSWTWILKPASPSVRWTWSGGAVSYDVFVDRATSFSKLPQIPSGNAFSGSIIWTSLTGSVLADDGAYSVCVRGKNSAAKTGKWGCATFWFDSTSPTVPVLAKPSDWARIGSLLSDVSWNASSDSGIGMSWATYHYEVSESLWMASVVMTGSTDFTWTSVASLPDGRYYWRARVSDSLSNVSAWSQIRSFTKDTVPPPAPTEIVFNAWESVNVSNQKSLSLSALGSAETAGYRAKYSLSVWTWSVVWEWTVAADGRIEISWIDASPLKDGALDVWVVIIDDIWNVSSTWAVQAYKDSVAPTGSVSFLSGSYVNASMTFVEISASEPSVFTLSGTGLTETVTGSVSWNAASVVAVTLSEGDGKKPIFLMLKDAWGSSSPKYATNVVLDTVVPTLKLNSHDDGASVVWPVAALSGMAEDANGVASVRVGGMLANWTGSWSRQTSLSGGANPFEIVASDRAWNSASISFTLFRVPAKPAPYVSVVSGDSMKIVFATDVPSVWYVDFGTSESLGGTAEGTSSGNKHSVVLEKLTEGTRYWFRAYASVDWKNGPASLTGSFLTPKSVEPSSFRGKFEWPVRVSWATSSWISLSVWPGLEIRSSNGSWSVRIDAGTLSVSTASWNWDGIISPPEPVGYSGGLSVSGYAIMPEFAVKAGSESDSLSFVWPKVTLRIPVPERLEWKTVKMYRSQNDQASFAFVADCVVKSWICEFATPGFSVFVPLEWADSSADPVTFVPVIWAVPNSDVVSNPVTVSGTNVSVTWSSVGWTIVVNGTEYGTSATIPPGASVSLRVKASSSPNSETVASLAFWWVAGTFSVTTGSSSGFGSTGGGGHNASSTKGVRNSSSVASWIAGSGGTSDSSDASSRKNFAVKDVSNHWSKAYVLDLVRLGIVNNAPKFRPDDSLTRAEFLKIALNAAEVEIPGSVPDSKFSDVSSDSWYAPYVAAALEKGVISGNSDKFRPDDRITRAEVAKILSGLLDDAASEAAEPGVFSDVPKESEFAAPISFLYAKGLFSGQVSGDVRVFRPTDSITRAEIAKVTSIGFELALR